jgi:uncharacterized phage-like protein YoqJ
MRKSVRKQAKHLFDFSLTEPSFFDTMQAGEEGCFMPESDRSRCCCFTGHRPNKLPWGENEYDPRCVAVKEWLDDAVEQAYQDGYRHFLCGMALGCDLYFCEAVLRLRERHEDVILEAAIPCPQQADRWSAAQQERYRRLCALCDLETVVQPFYDRSCMLRRDKYMVSRSSRIIAVFNGTSGGTMHTLLYAIRDHLELVEFYLDPPESC